jgi:hypothetical protein
MINYPTSLDTLTNPTATDPQNNPSHSEQHANANDAIEALQAKVGVNGSAVTTSHEYKISSIESAYQIVPSVSSNNLTVALKTLAGNDPSASDPVRIRIGNTIHSITSALSVTKNAGTNWCNAGSAELATQLVAYFVYLGYNATDGVTLGFSRIPYGALYSDFSATTTNEKYCAISTITNATAGDNYANIGYFEATLSAGAGYTWTVPTFTATNLVNRPIYETRVLDFQPSWGANVTNPSIGNGSFNVKSYQIVGRELSVKIRISFGTTTSAGGGFWSFTCPFSVTFNNFHIGSGVAYNGVSYPVVIHPNYYWGFDGLTGSTHSPSLSGGVLSDVNPFTWANGNYAAFQMKYTL